MIPERKKNITATTSGCGPQMNTPVSRFLHSWLLFLSLWAGLCCRWMNSFHLCYMTFSFFNQIEFLWMYFPSESHWMTQVFSIMPTPPFVYLSAEIRLQRRPWGFRWVALTTLGSRYTRASSVVRHVFFSPMDSTWLKKMTLLLQCCLLICWTNVPFSEYVNIREWILTSESSFQISLVK